MSKTGTILKDQPNRWYTRGTSRWDEKRDNDLVFLYSVIEDSKSLSHLRLLQISQAFLSASIMTYENLRMCSLHCKELSFPQAQKEKRTGR